MHRLIPSRVGVAVGVVTAAGVVVTAAVVVAAGVVVTVVGSAVVTAAAGSPENMVVGSPVGMVAGLAAAAFVAVGLGVASGVVRLAVSVPGSVVSAEPRSVAGSAELDLMASAAEASASLAFAATGAFPSRQV